MTADDWRHRAKCRDEDPETFFPIGTTGPALLQAEAARQICLRCPVREACAEDAIESRAEFGIWAGMSEEELRHRVGLRHGVRVRGSGSCNRDKAHCPAGHPYDDANTAISREGFRRCRTCRNQRPSKNRNESTSDTHWASVQQALPDTAIESRSS